MMTRTARLAAFVIGSLAVFSCSSARENGFQERQGSDPTTPEGEGDGSSGGGFKDNGKAKGSPDDPCVPDPNNYDVPGNDCDDDGDGEVDNPPTCDKGLSEDGDAVDFAKAIGICAKASDKGYGLVSAKYTRGYQREDAPNPAQHGILAKFGDVIKPTEGKRLGVLSTGYASEYDGAGEKSFIPGKDWSTDLGSILGGVQGGGKAPPGFPKEVKACSSSPLPFPLPLPPGVGDTLSAVHDASVLRLELKAPRNAKGIKFDFNFHSSEWPKFVCSRFNDSFVAFLTAKGFNDGEGDNMSFDKDDNPVSVNSAFFDRCTPKATVGCEGTAKDHPTTSVCPGGVAELQGTGFGIEQEACGGTTVSGGATGWLTSSAPVNPGETFTLEFYIWDTGDGAMDSTVLIDNFSWIPTKVAAGTARAPK
jgi:hypothetical protein